MERQERFARAILDGFGSYFTSFQNITSQAKARFDSADWQVVQNASSNRIDLYKESTFQVQKKVDVIAGERLRDLEFWRSVRYVYAELISDYANFEIAETFFNSIYCATFKHRRIRDEYAFVFSSQGDLPPADIRRAYRTYNLKDDLEDLINSLLSDYQLGLPFEDLAKDIKNICGAIRKFSFDSGFGSNSPDVNFQVLEHHFFRNKAAYIVGRIVSSSDSMPFVIPLLHNNSNGIFADTILLGSDKVSVIFSFTRAYFMVDTSVPSQYVLFLQQLMPAKPISEIYSAIGHNKHGKTYYHRCAYRHIQSTEDKFILAPGTKGMVMSVFTLPSYDFVFKIIKDRFTPPKDMTRAQVKEKYKLVKRWDRVGRMADTQEFTNLAFARHRFSDELMEELHNVAPSLIEERGKALIIGHVYVERRMTPLNLYLRNATDEQLYAVMDEYGNAIKQLAAANIFPGDMLLKNFGVTRHGRVVFYDYDEIVPLEDCNFRKIPEPRNEADEFSDTPWYSVGENDIFPEEFRMFFSGNQRARKVFDSMHSEIFEMKFWKELQDQIKAGFIGDFFPYRRKYRFERDDGLLKEAI
ncbi:MAG: bifunctional isocitrate dehydrogenase kinase/phosphatase [Halieaceae bacterium]|nr:bifunctional isocitrate dehydrogenase kinase/phosphatase [Halieaceae bacterium]